MIYSGYAYPASRGDTFDSIALEVYGDEKYAAEILSLNPELTGKLVFDGGEMVYLPVIAIPEETYAEAKAPWKE